MPSWGVWIIHTPLSAEFLPLRSALELCALWELELEELRPLLARSESINLRLHKGVLDSLWRRAHESPGYIPGESAASYLTCSDL